MSVEDRKQQIEHLQELTGEESFEDLMSEFDKLVDMLREHGYTIEKRQEDGSKDRIEAVARALDTETEEAWRFLFLDAALAAADDPSEAKIEDALHYLKIAQEL